MFVHSAFYLFFELDDVDALAQQLRAFAIQQPQLGGSILLAREGINGVMAGPAAQVKAFEQRLLSDLRLGELTFKHSDCITRPFGRMKIHQKDQIVFMGVNNVDAAHYQPPEHTLLSPEQWRETIMQDDVVVIDNRNSFEYRLGHFTGAVDPGVRHFKDFPDYIQANLPQWTAQHKRLAMYCTGGIRCEKTAAWMHTLGVDVLQLKGGLLNYFAQIPDAHTDFQGECFVFDNRIALDTHLHETQTTLEQVYQHEPDGQWRIERAQRLQQAIQSNEPDDLTEHE